MELFMSSIGGKQDPRIKERGGRKDPGGRGRTKCKGSGASIPGSMDQVDLSKSKITWRDLWGLELFHISVAVPPGCPDNPNVRHGAGEEK